MNREQAILKTAEFITKYPERYNFFQGQVPDAPEAQACAVAWIGFFLGYPPGTSWTDIGAQQHIPVDVAQAVGMLYREEMGTPWRNPSKVANWLLYHLT